LPSALDILDDYYSQASFPDSKEMASKLGHWRKLVNDNHQYKDKALKSKDELLPRNGNFEEVDVIEAGIGAAVILSHPSFDPEIYNAKCAQ